MISDDATNIATYLANTLTALARHLGISSTICRSSALHDDKTLKAQERVISLCKLTNATHYVNPGGGTALYDRASFDTNKLRLHFLNCGASEYVQFGGEFISRLSIIDVLMFNSPSSIEEKLVQFDIT